MDNMINPFVELYVTEHISAEKFVKIFSPLLVSQPEVLSLFQPGNIVVAGLQGSGKTALLNLFKPEVLIAYKNSDTPWPLPESHSKFISAGINLAKSCAMDFGQRPICYPQDTKKDITPLFFVDFINYWIVDDFLSSLETLHLSKNADVKNFLGIDYSIEKKEYFAQDIIKNACWFGGLDKAKNYSEIRQLIKQRITSYREYLNFNSELPEFLVKTKTSPGEPISVAAASLKACEIIPNDLPVFVRIDQFEDLMGLEEGSNDNAQSFRKMVMKMLGTRDDRISYRIGARPYSFSPDFTMYATHSSVEERRDFQIVDVDSLLVGDQKRRALFKRFSNDVFRRRIKTSKIPIKSDSDVSAIRIFGGKARPEEKAAKYAKSGPRKIIRFLDNRLNGYKSHLQDLAETDPLSAKLGEAWLMQNITKKKPIDLEYVKDCPWESRTWWKKERIQQALLQIAASRQQRMVWYGFDDILALSGSNILVFLSLCQFIWSEHLRSLGSNSTGNLLPKNISSQIQNMGIQDASEYWFRKIKADPSGGDDRHRFLNVLGQFFRIKLRDDKNMSYPGNTGFSLPEKELELHKEIANFLDRCVAYGALQSFSHTPKTKSRGQSKKWYLSPILTPYFQIPTPRTKEPFYARINDLENWLERSDVYIKKRSNDREQKKYNQTGIQIEMDI